MAQEPHIFPHLSGAESLLLGQGGSRGRKLANDTALTSDFAGLDTGL